jgi:microcystin-dependent protein
MKRNYTLLLFLLATVSILAQTPEKMSYQLVLRDASNTLLTNQQVGIQISILQTTITGSAVYIETQTATTNINGLVSLEIGSGTSSDDFSAIDWSAGPYFIKTATDANGGSNYSIIGTSQLMSVPYALYAKTSGSSTPGPQGEPGIQGETGTVGTNGTNGAKGDTGDKGDVGDQGETGTDGTNGTNGEKGDTGDQGTQGIQGETGAAGEVNLPTAVNGNLITYDGTNWVAATPQNAVKITIGNAGGNLSFNNRSPYLAVNYIIAIYGVFPSRNSADPFIAEIIMFAGNFAPRGWAYCDGQILAISSNTALFSILGTTYGGDGRTTFGLPDLRGRSAIHVGYGHGPGLSTIRLGDRSGAETTTLTTNNLPSHTHAVVYE